MTEINDWGGDEIFRDVPKFFGTPDPEARHHVGSNGKKYQFIAALSIASSLASDHSRNPRSAHDIFNDLYTQLTMRNVNMSASTSNGAAESRRVLSAIEQIKGVGAIRSLADISIQSYLADLKLAHRLSATTEALGDGKYIVLPFPHDLAPAGQMRKKVPAWGVLTSFPNIPMSETEARDETTMASVVFPAHDHAVKMSISPDDLTLVIAAENRTVSDGDTGFTVGVAAR